VLDAVEEAMGLLKPGVRATGRIMALNSLENRVYEVEFEDQSQVVAKFYRPGRWTEEQISEEHVFLQKLEEAEIPVVVPLELQDGKHSKRLEQPTLAQSTNGIYFAVFPKVKGRLIDEFSKTKLETIGRYLARIHQVGKNWEPKHRLVMSVDEFGDRPFEFLMNSDFMDENFKAHYRNTAEHFLDLAEAKLENVHHQAVHGDCHLGNTLWNGEAPFFIDFDDLVIAPPVQDVWMILRGRDEETILQRETMLKAYEQMHHFNHDDLDLIEPLRGLRILYYSAWIAQRWEDPSFPKAFPDFGSPTYWNEEIQALNEICHLIEGVEI
jgi:Ser/Thr protein kinase RdoA (MazF antagonist)